MQISDLHSHQLLVADIGGSHITAGLCDAGKYAVLAESLRRADVSSKGRANDILDSWVDILRQVLACSNSAVLGIGIAMPGPFDYKNGISYIKGLNKYEALYGMDIKGYLAAALGIPAQKIRFRNDAESTIAGEVLAGAGKDCTRVMGITLGTGFGSAYSLRQATQDINLGSEPYRDSIADDFFSTRWFTRRYHELTGLSLSDGVKELAEIAGGSIVARNIFREFAADLADFLSKPVLQFNPELVIICGNIAKASQWFLPELVRNLPVVGTRLASLGENAALIGAAALFEIKD